jgi:hypothetical protein
VVGTFRGLSCRDKRAWGYTIVVVGTFRGQSCGDKQAWGCTIEQ